MTRKNSLEIGAVAPDFTSNDQNGKKIKLSDLKGKKVLLSFHPLAWTPVCDIQMRTLELKYEILEKMNVIPIGISIDSQYTKNAWAKAMGITKTSLIADFWPHGEIAKKYDLFIEKLGFSGRANILIDEKGLIELVKIYDIPEIPDIEEIINFIGN